LPPASGGEARAIEVVEARTHNLQGVSCRIPHRRVTVVSGPSGAGKSSLAFDTVFAEAQRRFVESMSTYARQFLEQLERPPVGEIRNVLPAIALAARNSIRGARATVGTATEIHDLLRLLYAARGTLHCPFGHGPARRATAAEAAAALGAGEAGARFTLVAPLVRPARGADAKLAELLRQGYARRLEGAAVARLEAGAAWRAAWDPLPLVLGRFAAGAATARLAATIEDGWRLGARVLEAVGETGERRRFVAAELSCATCGALFREPTPALFSFHSPLGACPTCGGFGRVIGVDAARVIPDPGRALAERPIAPWNTPAYADLYAPLFAAAKRRGVPREVPWRDLPPADRDWVWRGEGRFTNLDAFFRWLEGRSYKVHVRVLLARYRAYERCPDCAGGRLNREALAVRFAGLTLPELAALSVEQLRRKVAGWRAEAGSDAAAAHLVELLAERLHVLHAVGLDYLTLDRQARTLSGGEAQRIHLAAALGAGLTDTLYVLDEPTIGLHPKDGERLLALLRDLAAKGNTLLVVEHDRTILRGADHLIDLGPEAGERGGRLVVEGSVAQVIAHPESATGRFLRQRSATPARAHVARFRRERGRRSVEEELADRPRIAIVGAREHNLRGIDVSFPLDALVAVTGVSGSGKSTLVENVLYGTFQRARGVVDAEPGACDALLGLERLADVTLVDQSPIGRSARSNPATYVKAYDDLRRLFAGTEEARRRGIAAAHFSFNLETGRCPDCRGTGTIELDMQFMAPVTVACDACRGRRFRPEVLAVRHRGRDIATTLELTVERALDEFAREKTLCRKLAPLAEAGLGYLRLGQPTATLSGGEAQRLKLASFLARPRAERPRLFLFDEPTTGLHLADIDRLYKTLRKLVARGDGVVVVEHALDLVAHADWIVDLGPGGGSAGGELLHCGPLESFLDHPASPTAEALRRHLGRRRRPSGSSTIAREQRRRRVAAGRALRP
jgi:excinuclease ABC subunit A